MPTLLENASFLANVDFWYEALKFSLLLIGVYIIRFLLKLGFEGLKKSKQNVIRIEPVFSSLLNWVTYYGVILLILIYFSDASWMFGEIFTIGEVRVSLFLLLIALIIVSFAHRASKILTSFLLPSVYDRYQLDRGLRYTFDRIFHYAIMGIAIIVSLTTVGINLSALTVFAGVVGVGIGFGLQNIASNFISGIILLF